MKAKAYSYLRFSTADQARGDSERRQIELGRKWCESQGIQFAENYRDLGVSAFRGTNSEKGHLAQFLAKVRAGVIEKGAVLVVESLDRLSRQSILDALSQFLEIINAGVGVVTLADGKHYTREKMNDNYTDLIVSLTIMSRANEESRVKSGRVGEAWRAKRNRIASEPMTSRCVAWLELDKERKKFVPIPEKAKVVRGIFESAAAGMGANAITKDLNRRNVPALGSSKVWNLSYVKKILSNRAVIGEFAPATRASGKREFLDPVAGYYPAVVPLATFAKVNALRAARPSYRGKSGFNVFSHMAFDMATGCAMAYVNKSRKKGWHYLVPSSAVIGKGDYHSWQYDDFKESVLTVFKDGARRKAPAPSAKPDRAAELRGELADVDAKVKRLVGFLAEGTMAGVETKLRELEAKRVALQDALTAAADASRVERIDLVQIDWEDNDALRENLRATVKRIEVDAGKKEFVIYTVDGREFGLVRDGDKVKFTSQ